MNPQDGLLYRVGVSPVGEWSDKADSLALFIGGDWHYIAPFYGMRMFDRETGAQLFFDSVWRSAVQPSSPTGGTTIDEQSRQSISEIMSALESLGLFAPTTNNV